MRAVGLTVIAALALGCGDSRSTGDRPAPAPEPAAEAGPPDPAEPPTPAALIQTLTDGVTAACACTDADCFHREAAPVHEASQAFLALYGMSKDPDAQARGAEMLRQLEIVDRCRKRLAGQPSSPDAPSP